MSVLIILVLPKIRRVLSGEKVVVTNALAARYANSGSSSEDALSHSDRPRYLVGAPLQLKKDDPMPRELETHLYDLQGLLRTVTKQNGQGRPLSAAQWRTLQIDVARLKAELDRIDLSLLSGDLLAQELPVEASTQSFSNMAPGVEANKSEEALGNKMIHDDKESNDIEAPTS
jgi:hypothetical protein